MEKLIDGQIAIVIGSNGNLGQAIVRDLVKFGISVESCDRNKKLKSESMSNHTIVDISIQEMVNSFVEDVHSRHKRIDFTINCSGVLLDENGIENISNEIYEETFNVNTRSIFYFSKAILPIMKKQRGGVIVNITSTAGIYANARFPVYSASKFAARGLTQAIGKSLDGTGVKYFSVAPAGINSPMRKKFFGEEDSKKQQSPEEVSRVIIDAILNKTDVQNGGEIVVRGGKIDSIDNPLKR